jgi:hypothetical protein
MLKNPVFNRNGIALSKIQLYGWMEFYCLNGRVKMIFSKGFLHRFGTSVKEAGECAGHRGCWYTGAVIRIGLAIRDFADLFPVNGKWYGRG